MADFDPDAWLAQQQSPDSSIMRGMWYGKNFGEFNHAANYGPTGQPLQDFDVAASPDSGLPLGSYINTNYGLRRVGDLSYKSPGVPTHHAIEFRDVKADNPVQVSPAKFDPDAYLASKTFDPDAYLASKTAQVGPPPKAQPSTAMSPEEMSRTGQIRREPAEVTAGTEPTKISEALKENIQPLVEHPLQSAYDMTIAPERFKQDYDVIKTILTNPREAFRRDTPIGSQEWYNQAVGNALLLMGGRRALERPSRATERAIPEPTRPVESPEVPKATETPQQGKARFFAASEKLKAQGGDPIAVSEELATSMGSRNPNWSQMADAIEAKLTQEEKTATLKPQNEQRDTDQTVGQSAGQQPPIPERPASVAVPGASRTGPETSPLVAAAQKVSVGPTNAAAESRAEMGLVGRLPPGLGDTLADSRNRGELLLKQGNDPFEIVRTATKRAQRTTSEMDAVNAGIQRLSSDTNRAYDALRANPGPETRAAFDLASKREYDLRNAFQPMKTEWANQGNGLQAFDDVTDQDYGTYLGIRRAFSNRNKTMPTPSQEAILDKLSTEVSRADERVKSALDRSTPPRTRPPRDYAQLSRDLAAKLKEITC